MLLEFTVFPFPGGGIVLDDFTFRTGYMYRFVPGSTGLNNVHESSLVVWVNHHFDFFDDDAEPVLPEVLNP